MTSDRAVVSGGRLLAAAALLTPVLLAASLLVAPLASGTPQRALGTTIVVTIHDASFKLSATSAPPGPVVFSVKNAGKLAHSFKIGAQTTPVLASGKTARLVVTFAKAGTATYASTVPGDPGKGLKGVFTIQGAALPPGVAGDPVNGKRLFLATSCGTCHTLKAAGAKGEEGPDLDETPSLYTTLVTEITHGGEGMMPFANVLTRAEIEDVAAFVYLSTHP